MNLYVVYVGGKTASSLIEVHDIHFALGDRIEDTYDQLKKQWWGTPKSLHIDAWGVVNCVDGYDVLIADTPARDGEKKLFFVNLGGYDLNEFTELHKNIFLVGEDVSEIKRRAKTSVSHWKAPHRDNLYEVDECVNVSKLLKKNNVFIHLKPSENPKPFMFTCKYLPIGK